MALEKERCAILQKVEEQTGFRADCVHRGKCKYIECPVMRDRGWFDGAVEYFKSMALDGEKALNRAIESFENKPSG